MCYIVSQTTQGWRKRREGSPTEVTQNCCPLVMGSASSQSETPTTTSRSQEEWKPIRLCGALPAEIVPAEHYVEQLWKALDMTHDQAQSGLRSDTPVGQGGTLDTTTFTIRGAIASVSAKTQPPPDVPPPPDYLPDMADELIVMNTVKALSPRIVAVQWTMVPRELGSQRYSR